MNGLAIFNRYYKTSQLSEPGSPDWVYGQTLRTALWVVGGEKLYLMLEEAESAGQQIELTYPIPIEEGPSEPNGIRLVTLAKAL